MAVYPFITEAGFAPLGYPYEFKVDHSGLCMTQMRDNFADRNQAISPETRLYWGAEDYWGDEIFVSTFMGGQSSYAVYEFPENKCLTNILGTIDNDTGAIVNVRYEWGPMPD